MVWSVDAETSVSHAIFKLGYMTYLPCYACSFGGIVWLKMALVTQTATQVC